MSNSWWNRSPTWSPTAHSTVAETDTVSLNSSRGSVPTRTWAVVSIIAPVLEMLRMRTSSLV